jgi:ABC-type bacteriocin/lantibiotic exporter with double-glycine peptidase domain
MCIVLPAVLTAATGCRTKATQGGNSSANNTVKIIDGVPFVEQNDKFCGPAAMASVLEYYGDDVTQEEIAEAVYTPKLDGALISDMENLARDSGYRAETINGNIGLLEAEIDKGVPAILLVEKGKWMVSVPHYYVAYGYDADEKFIIVHTGYESGESIPFDRLDGEWEKMNRLMLVITK